MKGGIPQVPKLNSGRAPECNSSARRRLWQILHQSFGLLLTGSHSGGPGIDGPLNLGITLCKKANSFKPRARNPSQINTGALTIRVGFWGVPYFKYSIIYHKNYSNYYDPYIFSIIREGGSRWQIVIDARRSESLRVWLWCSAIAARRLGSTLADAACLQHVLGGGLDAGLHFSGLGHDHMQLHDSLGALTIRTGLWGIIYIVLYL